MVAGRLFLWSTACDEWVSCAHDEIIWLDRSTLSDNEDVTLHRAPRCAGLRHVQHRWELFSRDTTYPVYLAPDTAGTPLSAEAVRRTARHVLPVAPESYEARPVVLDQGLWVVGVAAWVLRLRLDMPTEADVDADDPDDDEEVVTRANESVRRGPVAGATRKDAVARVRGWLGKYREIELLLQMGEYQKGADSESDEAIAHMPGLRQFLQQRPDEFTDFRTATANLLHVVGDSHHG